MVSTTQLALITLQTHPHTHTHPHIIPLPPPPSSSLRILHCRQFLASYCTTHHLMPHTKGGSGKRQAASPTTKHSLSPSLVEIMSAYRRIFPKTRSKKETHAAHTHLHSHSPIYATLYSPRERRRGKVPCRKQKGPKRTCAIHRGIDFISPTSGK